MGPVSPGIDKIGPYAHYNQQLRYGISAHDQDAGLSKFMKESTDRNCPVRDEKEDSANEDLPERGLVTFFEALSRSSDHCHNDYHVGNDWNPHASQIGMYEIVDKGCCEVDGKIVKERFYEVDLHCGPELALCNLETNDIANMRHQKGA